MVVSLNSDLLASELRDIRKANAKDIRGIAKDETASANGQEHGIGNWSAIACAHVLLWIAARSGLYRLLIHTGFMQHSQEFWMQNLARFIGTTNDDDGTNAEC